MRWSADEKDVLQCLSLECVVVSTPLLIENAADAFVGTPIRLEKGMQLSQVLSQCASSKSLSAWLEQYRQPLWKPQMNEIVMVQFLEDRLLYRAKYLGPESVVFEGYGNSQPLVENMFYKAPTVLQ